MLENELLVLRVNYRKINAKCYICDGPSTIVRCTQASDGEIYIATLCAKHAKEEQQHIVAEGALESVQGTGTFVNKNLYEKLDAADK